MHSLAQLLLDCLVSQKLPHQVALQAMSKMGDSQGRKTAGWPGTRAQAPKRLRAKPGAVLFISLLLLLLRASCGGVAAMRSCKEDDATATADATKGGIIIESNY